MSMATGNAVEIATDILLLHDYFRNQNALVFVHLILKVKKRIMKEIRKNPAYNSKLELVYSKCLPWTFNYRGILIHYTSTLIKNLIVSFG